MNIDTAQGVLYLMRLLDMSPHEFAKVIDVTNTVTYRWRCNPEMRISSATQHKILDFIGSDAYYEAIGISVMDCVEVLKKLKHKLGVKYPELADLIGISKGAMYGIINRKHVPTYYSKTLIYRYWKRVRG